MGAGFRGIANTPISSVELYMHNLERISALMLTFLLGLSLAGCTLDASILSEALNAAPAITTPGGGGGGGNGGVALSRLNYTFDGPITDHVIDGNIAYIAGNFSSTGKSSYGPIVLDNALAVTKNLNFSYQGWIYATAEDSLGRLYLAGDFQVPGTNRKNFVRMTAQGVLDDTFPDLALDGTVSDIKFLNGVVYLMGQFSKVKGQSRIGGASFDMNTLALTEWNPLIWGGGRSLQIVDSQRIAISGNHSVYNNSMIGLTYVDDTGNLINLTPNLATQAPGFTPQTVISAGSGVYYLFDPTGKLLRVKANGDVDTNFGIQTVADNLTNSFMFNGEIYALISIDTQVKFVRYSATTGAKLGEVLSTETITRNCTPSYVSQSALAVPNSAQNKIYVSTNCKMHIDAGGVGSDRTSGFMEFVVSGASMSMTSFDPNYSLPLIMDMQIFDNVLYLQTFTEGVKALDLANSNAELFTVGSFNYYAGFAVGAEGLYLMNMNAGSPAHTFISSYDPKTGAAITGKLAVGASSVDIVGQSQGLYHSGSKLYAFTNNNSIFPGSALYVFDLNGGRVDSTVVQSQLGYGCNTVTRQSGMPGVCVVGSQMGGTKDKGLYIYNTVNKTVETDRVSKLPDFLYSPWVVASYFDDDYEVYAVSAAYDYDPNVWASPGSTYGRLFVYRKGDSSPLYVNRISISNSSIYFARQGDKLVISGLAYFADVSWIFSSNVSNCTGTCKQLTGMMAMDLTTGLAIDGFASDLPGSGDNYNNYYNYRIFVRGNDLHICYGNSGVTLKVYDTVTGLVKPAGYQFQMQPNGNCGPWLNRADGNLFFALNAGILYDTQLVGPFVSVDMTTGVLTDYHLDGSVSAIQQAGRHLFVATKNSTQGFGGALSGKLLSFDMDGKTGATESLGTLDPLFSGDIKLLAYGGDKLALVGDNNLIAFMQVDASGTLTAMDKAFSSSGTITGVEAVSGQMYVVGDLQNIIGGQISTSTVVENFSSVGMLMRVSLADLSAHTMAPALVASTYGAMLSIPATLKAIGSDIYLIGLETVNGSLQSIARFNGSDGSFDAAFKPVVSYNYMGMLTLNGLILDIAKTESGDLSFGGLFTVSSGGQSINFSANFDFATGAVIGGSTVPFPDYSLVSPNAYKMEFGAQAERVLFSNILATGLSSFSIY